MEYDMELHANGKQYGIAFERNGKLFQNDDIDYNIYSFYINGEKIGEFGHTYPKKATFNINKYLPLIEKMVHNEGAIWGWEKANAINKSKRTIKLSESRLREIITESVKMVISELDWKTTSNASDKQSLGGYAKGDDGKAAFKRNFARKGGIDRYFKFRDYTDNAANRKFFGQEGGVDFLPNDNASQPNWVGFWCGHPTVRVYQGETQIGDIEPSCLWRARGFNFETMCIFDKYINGGESTIASPITPEEIKNYFGDEIKLYQRFMEAVQEYTDLKSNKYTYDNEKGWHLKESNNNQYICHKKVRLTENELRGVIRKVIEEAVDESGYLQGAHKATLDNLNRKKDMGVTHTIRPKGGKGATPISIPNSERFNTIRYA